MRLVVLQRTLSVAGMFTLAPGVTLSQGEAGLIWRITVAWVEPVVPTVTVWAGLTPPLGMLLNASGLLALVWGVTVSWGCADAVSEQPKTAKAAKAAKINGLGQFMTTSFLSARQETAILLPFEYKTNLEENVFFWTTRGKPNASPERLL